ncbi:MAG: hypothetical protein KAS12_05300 [Candidatus Aenigmarchaeota archaeon]|nr:hypothetical protein [Candidatus Aenigmarchaeota archaeon]
MSDLKAPKGKFRIVCVDTFDEIDWVEADVLTLKKAKKIARKKSGNMLRAYVYDDQGICHFFSGTY